MYKQANDLYPSAIEQTKMKRLEDIDHFLETSERLPSFKQYLLERN